MRIAIDTLFERATRPSSAVDYLENLAAYLPKVGPQHTYFLFVGPLAAERFKSSSRPNVSLVNCLFSNEHRALRILAQQSLIPWHMKRLKADVLFSAGNVCPIAGDFCKVVKINTLHHYSAPKMIGHLKAKYRRLAFGLSAQVANCIVANSHATRDDIRNFMGVDAGKVTVVWEAVDDVFTPCSDVELRMVRERHQIARPYILFASTLWPYKNAETLIRAFAKLLKERGLDYELILAGRVDDSAHFERLKETAQEEGVTDRVKFLGFLPNRQMPALYSAARVFAYPSLSETFGKPLVEAMRCGVPIVASDASCIPEILGNAGLLVDPHDVDKMAEMIYVAATDERLRADLIARGYRRGQEFSWETSAKQTLAVLEEAFVNWRASRASS